MFLVASGGAVGASLRLIFINMIKVMNLLSKMLKIESKPKYEKITKYGHYNINPYTYKKKTEIKYYPKRNIDIKQGLIDLIKELSFKKF